MPSPTFYGGVNEIGRNKILLGDEGRRIFLDFWAIFETEKVQRDAAVLSFISYWLDH